MRLGASVSLDAKARSTLLTATANLLCGTYWLLYSGTLGRQGHTKLLQLVSQHRDLVLCYGKR